jgi:hypothetical protein
VAARSGPRSGRLFSAGLVKVGGVLAVLAAVVIPALAVDPPVPSPLSVVSNSAPAVPVVVVEDGQATEFFQPRADRVRMMVARGIEAFTGKSSVPLAWRSLLGTNDTVAIKVYAAAGSVAGTRLAVVAAVVEELLEAGLAPGQILIWDKRRDDLDRAGFTSLAARYGVQVTGAAEAGYESGKSYEHALLGRLVLTDKEFHAEGGGLGSRRSHYTRLLTRRSLKIISIAPLLSSNAAGTSGHVLSLALGSVDNTRRFEINGSSLAVAAPEILAQSDVPEHLLLCITDALVAQYLGEEEPRLHYSNELRQLWFSRDPVALDTLALRELARARKAAGVPDMPLNEDLYRNAALMELGVNDPARIEVKKAR